MKSLGDKLRELPASRQRAIAAGVEALRKTLPLGAIRRMFNRSQADVAAALGVSQGAISQMEGRGDVLLSTLFDYVRAIGGKSTVRIDAHGKKLCISGTRDADGWIFTVDERDRGYDQLKLGGFRTNTVMSVGNRHFLDEEFASRPPVPNPQDFHITHRVTPRHV